MVYDSQVKPRKAIGLKKNKSKAFFFRLERLFVWFLSFRIVPIVIVAVLLAATSHPFVHPSIHPSIHPPLISTRACPASLSARDPAPGSCAPVGVSVG